MNNININNMGYSQYIPQIKNNKAQNNSQNAQVSYSYPVYTQIPYGINKKDYIKVGIQKLPSGEDLHIYTLTTGQKVGIVKSKFNCPMIYNRVNTGACDEPDGKEGLSHLIEHSIYHASKKYPDGIDKNIKAIGGYSNAHTNSYETSYYIKLNDSSKLDKALDINADMLYNPLFSKLKKEKPIVISEIQQRQADEYYNMIRDIDKELLLINKPEIKDIVAGSFNSVNSISEKDMFDYHSKHYTPSNITTVILSDREPDELINLAAQKFKQASGDKIFPPLPKKNFQQINTIKRRDIFSKDSAKKKMYVSFCIPKANKTENIKLAALIELIKKRLDFDGSYEDLYDNSGSLTFEYIKDDFSEYEAFEYLKQGLYKIIQNPPNDYELQSISAILNRQCDTQYENADTEARSICDELQSNKYTFADKKIIENLKKEDIVDALKYIDFSKCLISVLHPKNTKKEDLDKNLKNYQKYVQPANLPFEIQDVNINNSLISHEIKPYTNSAIYSTTLPDNTNLYMSNSKNDNCNITWQLYNTKMSNYNPAIKYVLNEFANESNILELLKVVEKGVVASIDFNTYDGVELRAKCSKETLDLAVKSLKNNLRIDFREELFKQAKEKALSAIRAEKETAYDKRNYDKYGIIDLKNPEKLEQELEKVTINDVRQYCNELINNSYSLVSIVAPFDKNPDLFNKVASALNFPNVKFKKTDNDLFEKVYSQNQETKVYIAANENTQPEFEKIYNFLISSNPEDELKFNILANVLNNRLYNDLREKQGLAYSADASYGNWGNSGKITLSLSSDCKNKNDIEKVFKGFDFNIKRLINEPVTYDELEEAKNDFKKDMLDCFDDIKCINYKILNATKMSTGLEIYKNNFEIIDAITPQDIQKTAKYVFSTKPDYLIDAPQDFLDKNRDYFKTLGKIKE